MNAKKSTTSTTMTDETTSRRNFLQNLGLTAGSVLLATTGLAKSIDPESIKKLNPEQQAFMNRYGLWMDDFIEVIRIQKTDRNNEENNKKMIILTEEAEKFKPELAVHMKDETFSLIYIASVQRMSNEI
ncbi:MAG: twin-arginine translocation signal domain-containing protein [Bacteroidetes bacterium]|nr:twin-arginine translocation signal domain-containing protein [Bacteroidota bacterium]